MFRHQSGVEQSPVSLLDRLTTFVDPTHGEGHPVHGLHPYPAKYIPCLPREVIAEHTNERHTVLDPFCGSGTTLVEAARMGRKSIGVDSNPIAILVSRAKTAVLDDNQLSIVSSVLSRVRKTDGVPRPVLSPALPDPQHWFQRNMIAELSWLLTQCRLVRDPAARNLLLCVFSSIVTSASNQDSETRYKATEKHLPDGYALDRFARRLEAAITAVADWSALDKPRRNRPTVIELDARYLRRKIPDASVDLIVTSPPYPNSFDYYLYHKLRMAWLGYDYRKVQETEIGSRYEHSSRKAPVETFSAKMLPVMTALGRVLKPGKLAYLFVGDAVVAGNTVDMRDIYNPLAEKAGLDLVGERQYSLTAVSRSFRDTRDAAGNRHRANKMQRVLVYEGTNRARTPATTRNGPKAIPVPSLVPTTIGSAARDGASIAIHSDDKDRHVHSIVPFPSKFIPEVPRWAIESFSQRGDRVLDPFGGSGTTAVEALLLGRHTVSVDVSPYATLVATAKTTRSQPAKIEKAALELADALAIPARLPKAERIRIPLEDFWFDVRHLDEFARIDAFIATRIPRGLRPFFRTLLAGTIRAFSYQDAGQIKVKRDPKKVARGTPSPSQVLAKRLNSAVQRLLEFVGRADPRASALAITGSSDQDETYPPGQFDLIVTSPPYVNAMNYPMASRNELLLLGLVPTDDYVSHTSRYIGTERVYSDEFGTLHEAPASWGRAAHDLNPLLRRVYEGEPKRAYIAFEYFRRMRDSFAAALRHLRPGGRFVLVAGTNTIRGVPIDTFRILTEMLEAAGCSREMEFHYEIVKQVLKITRHATARLIPRDGVAVLRAPEG